MKTEVILFFPRQPNVRFHFFATKRPSPLAKHLFVDSSEKLLVEAHKGVQKERSAYRKHFLQANFTTVAFKHCVEEFLFGSNFGKI